MKCEIFSLYFLKFKDYLILIIINHKIINKILIRYKLYNLNKILLNNKIINLDLINSNNHNNNLDLHLYNHNNHNNSRIHFNLEVCNKIKHFNSIINNKIIKNKK